MQGAQPHEAVGETAAFLRHILGDEPWHAAAVFRVEHNLDPNCRPGHHWFQRVDELAAFLLKEDAAGKAVFHACATYGANARRRAADAAGAKALWCDLDAGPGKPYPDADTAWDALCAFVEVTGLPEPTVVASGYGLHAYWVLDRLLPPAEWLRLAQALKAACEINGLAIDPHRATDIASILRPPGTHNRKDPANPQPVTAGDLLGPYPVEAFAHILPAAAPAANVVAFPARRVGEAAAAGIRATPDMRQGYPEGQRDQECTKRAGWLIGKGLQLEEVLSRLLEWNKLNTPPMPADQVYKCANSIWEREQGKLVQQADDIELLNQKHFVVGNIGGKCAIGEWVPSAIDASVPVLAFQQPASFKVRYSAHYSGGKPLGDVWLKHPRRLNFEGIDLVPNGPPVLPNNVLNLWRGYGVAPKRGSWLTINDHIVNVLGSGNEEWAKYILRWFAWGAQHPQLPAEAALVLRGKKGTGKGMIGDAMCRLYGAHALHIHNQQHLTGTFNAHLRLCVFLFADEAFWAGDKKGEAILKGLITDPVKMVEAKGYDAVQILNRTKVLMCANEKWVIPASHDERRYAMFNVSDHRMGDRAYFRQLLEEIQNGGLAAMLHDMLAWDLGDWHPRDIIHNEALREQKEASLPPLEQWLEGLLQHGRLPGFSVLQQGGLVTNNAIMNELKEEFPRGNFNSTWLGRFLCEWGCEQRRTAVARGYAFPPIKEMRAKWESRYGGWPWREEIGQWG